jgi:hypothetical protein
MKATSKLILTVTMSLALLLGFLDPIWPDAVVSLKRLHIFFFNLCSGGAIILYFTEKRDTFSPKVKLFFSVAALYALSAAAGLYPVTLVLTLPLFVIVESVRIKRFSFLPLDFFKGSVSVGDKFNHASLLCLSIGTIIAALVILNNQYLNIVTYEKLTLDVFFLGYSFPISLITMSVMFSFMSPSKNRLIHLLKEICFWTVNLGVIIFFAFIILGLMIPEIIIATTLFLTVFVIFLLFVSTTPSLQQKTFLTSGMLFLLTTGLTGVVYILRYFTPVVSDDLAVLTLILHVMVSLYGWNLSGLFIIIRCHDFPIRLSSTASIALHWVIVLVLAPLGKYWPAVGLVAVPAYLILLWMVFWSRGRGPAVSPCAT